MDRVNRSAITLNGQHVGDNSFSGWTMRGAENVNGTKQCLPGTNTDGTLSPWTLNSNWQHTGSTLYPPGFLWLLPN